MAARRRRRHHRLDRRTVAVVGTVALVGAIAVGLIASAAMRATVHNGHRGQDRSAPTTTATPADLGSGFRLPWPSQGQATVDVEGIGSLGVEGDQRPVPIASVTKVMTALVILDDHPLRGEDQGPTIRVDGAAAAEAGDSRQSTVRVQAGQSFSEHDLLEMMLIPSGNNIARLLARWDAGSERAFVAKMNDAAHRLGMAHTTYTGASGFEDSTTSTAVDQLKLAEKVIGYDAFARIVDLPTATIPGLRDKLVNTNTLLGDHGVIGMKTGSSTPAGGALMWAARQPDASGRLRLVLGVVLDQHRGSSPDDDLHAVLDTSRTLVHGVADALASTR